MHHTALTAYGSGCPAAGMAVFAMALPMLHCYILFSLWVHIDQHASRLLLDSLLLGEQLVMLPLGVQYACLLACLSNATDHHITRKADFRMG